VSYFKSQTHPAHVTLLHSIVVGPYVTWDYRIVDNRGTKHGLDVLEVRHGKIVSEWEPRDRY
jgi:hypothetical protein